MPELVLVPLVFVPVLRPAPSPPAPDPDDAPLDPHAESAAPPNETAASEAKKTWRKLFMRASNQLIRGLAISPKVAASVRPGARFRAPQSSPCRSAVDGWAGF
jgi:hypothetical protein